MKQQQQPGFSLIELILIMVILTVAAVPILGQFTQVASSTVINENIQTASQLAQERAEEILALRRNQGYEAITLGTSNEVLTGNYANFSRTVMITEPPDTGGCPTSAICKEVVVTVNHARKKRAEIVTVLVDY